MKDAVVYSLLAPTLSSSDDNISQLYYSLETLCSQEGEHDICLFYSSAEDVEKYDHLGKYNLRRDFPKLKIERIDYDYDHTTAHKWLAIQNVIGAGYDRVLYVDNDTFFSRDPSYLFKKYGKGRFWIIYDRSDAGMLCEKVTGWRGMNSGQFLFHAELLHEYRDNLFELYIRERESLLDKARQALEGEELKYFEWLSEQFAFHQFLLNNGIPIGELDTKTDFALSSVSITLDHSREHCSFEKTVNHYMSPFSPLWLRKELWTDQTYSKFMSKNMRDFLKRYRICEKCGHLLNFDRGTFFG